MSGISNGSRAQGKISSKLKPAFVALLEAFDYAEDTGSDRWDFAVAIRHVRKLGVSEADLRWLVRKGYVEHAREVTGLDEDGREFRPTGDLSFCKRTCFVLTIDGVKCARSAVFENGASLAGSTNSRKRREIREQEISKSIEVVPIWDAERHELRVNGDVVKQFKWCAANQETILAAFEEDHWPVRIDDPLPPHPEQDSKRRLSDTIKCLNRKQKHPLIHFRGDGTGEGVIWEFVGLHD